MMNGNSSNGNYQRDTNLEIIVRGHGSDISIVFSDPIKIPSHIYEGKIGLKSFVTYNNIPNVVEYANNKLKIKVPGESEYIVCSLATGAYELNAISEKIQEYIEEKYPHLENVEENIKIVGNDATQKADIFFKVDGYGIDFDVEHSIHAMLGFNREDKYERRGRYSGSRTVDIIQVTQLIFNTNVSEANFINNQAVLFLFNCSLDVPPGYRIQRELSNISYKRLTTDQISMLRVWVTDQKGNAVLLRDEELCVTLSLRMERLVSKVQIDDGK